MYPATTIILHYLQILDLLSSYLLCLHSSLEPLYHQQQQQQRLTEVRYSLHQYYKFSSAGIPCILPSRPLYSLANILGVVDRSSVFSLLLVYHSLLLYSYIGALLTLIMTPHSLPLQPSCYKFEFITLPVTTNLQITHVPKLMNPPRMSTQT